MSKMRRSYSVVSTYRIYERTATGGTLSTADRIVQALAQDFNRPHHKSAPEIMVVKLPLSDRDKLEDRGIKYYPRGDYVAVSVSEYRIGTEFTSRVAANRHAKVLESQPPAMLKSIEIIETRHGSTQDII